MAIAAFKDMHTELTAAVTTPIRDHFLADHRRLETLVEEVLAAFEANDRQEVARLWTEFELGLLAHLEAEEVHLIPGLLRVCERDARVIVQEHRHIRTRLTELGVTVDLHTIRLDSARDFIDELRAHSKNEDRLLYRWGDAHLDESERKSLFAALAAGLRARVESTV
jgi:hemerythrin superfamily protein